MFSDDGTRLASTSRAGDLHVRSIATNAVQSFPEKAGKISELVWSHDNAMIATVNDTQLLLWELATGKSRVALRSGSGAGIRSIAFSPDGKRIAVLTRDGVTHLIDTVTLANRVLGTLDDHATEVAYWYDGKSITTLTNNTSATWRDDVPAEPAALHDWFVAAAMVNVAP